MKKHTLAILERISLTHNNGIRKKPGPKAETKSYDSTGSSAINIFCIQIDMVRPERKSFEPDVDISSVVMQPSVSFLAS